MSPKIVDKDLKASEIARAALGLFAKKGYSATSVKQIAEVAGIGKGTVYEYFDTKEDIFVAGIREWVNDIERQLSDSLKGIDDPIRRLHVVARMNIELCDPDDPDTARLFFEIIQQAFLKGGAFYKRRYIMKELHIGMRRMVVNILLDGVSRGLFRPEIARHSEKFAINLLAYLDGLVFHGIFSKGYFDVNEQVDFYLQNLTRAILAKPRVEDQKIPWSENRVQP
jgi:AcrR family transcriptional regulator